MSAVEGVPQPFTPWRFPMLTYLKRLVDERTALTEVATRMADAAADADRDLSDAERGQLAEMQQRCAELDTQIGTYNGQAESARTYSAMLAAMADREPDSHPFGPGAAVQTREANEIERLTAWLEGDEFRSYPGRGNGPAIDVHGYLETRAAITTSQLNIQPYVWPTRDRVERFPILDLLNRVQVSSGAIEWNEVGPAPTAAVVAEGALKPEAALTITPKTAALETIAHWLSITRQALEDAPYMRSIIEGKLRTGLLKKVSADAIAALIAATLPTTAGVDLMSAIRVAIATVEAAGYDPNAVAVNPADAATLDLSALGALGGLTSVNGQSAIWGIRIVSVPGLVAGTAIVGDFSEGLTLFDRGVSSVFVTDSHADFFLRNQLVILAEARVKSVVTDLAAFCEATKTP